MTDELNKIVAGLSDAQRDHLLRRTSMTAPKDIKVHFVAKGLWMPNWRPLFVRGEEHLSSLGLAVRAHLQKETK